MCLGAFQTLAKPLAGPELPGALARIATLRAGRATRPRATGARYNLARDRIRSTVARSAHCGPEILSGAGALLAPAWANRAGPMFAPIFR
jgi:hypothetical protein